MPLSSEQWIMRPFNGLFLVVFSGFVVLLIIVSLILRKQSERTRETVLISACVITLIGFIVYKYFLSIDSDYNLITAEMGGFNWWGELPLQLCNINMIIIPIAVLKKNRPMMCFGFFAGSLGALMALTMPANGFDGYSLLLPRMLGYYGTHFMIVIEGLAIVTFGLLRPQLRDFPRAEIALFLTSLCIFVINLLLRFSELHPKANYFYNVETEGNPLLEIFHKWIPIPFLYQVPCLAILGVYMILIIIPFELAGRKKRTKE